MHLQPFAEAEVIEETNKEGMEFNRTKICLFYTKNYRAQFR